MHDTELTCVEGYQAPMEAGMNPHLGPHARKTLPGKILLTGSKVTSERRALGPDAFVCVFIRVVMTRAGHDASSDGISFVHYTQTGRPQASNHARKHAKLCPKFFQSIPFFVSLLSESCCNVELIIYVGPDAHKCCTQLFICSLQFV